MNDPLLMAEEITNNVNDGAEGANTLNSSERLARYYFIACIIDRGAAIRD